MSGRNRHSILGRRPGRLLVACTCIAVLAGCSSTKGSSGNGDKSTVSTALSGSSTSSTTLGYTPELTDSDCAAADIPVGSIECMTLVVPETRSKPAGRQVELPVIRVTDSLEADGSHASTEPETAATTIVYLHGGPGAGAVEGWSGWQALVDGTGVSMIVYDQRGGGLSTPRLDCPERTQALESVLGAGTGFSAAHNQIGKSLKACHDRLQADGVDLSAYDTAASVADLDDLRGALGAEKLSIVASSYGTRLAVAYLRSHPDRVASVALGGVDRVEGSDPSLPNASAHFGEEKSLVEASIDRLVEWCVTDQGCSTNHPRFGAGIQGLAARFDAQPVSIVIPALEADPAISVLVRGSEIYAGLFGAMYDTETIPLLPELVDRLASGDLSVLDAVAPRLRPLLDGEESFGATMSINCGDAIAQSDVASDGDSSGGNGLAPDESPDPGVAATVILSGSDSYCGYWPIEPGDTVPHDSPTGTTAKPPMLVISGGLDPITPNEDSQKTATEFGAEFLSIPAGGHDVMFSDDCARSALRAFMAGNYRPDLSCA